MRKMTSNGPMNTRKAECLFLAIGLALLAIWAGAWFYRSLASRAAIERFQAEAAAAPGTDTSTLTWDASVANSATDFTLWNPKRVIAYKVSLSTKTDLPLGILLVPKIKLVVPVFNDTDDLTLNRGVGRILGTAQIGQLGNLGIAGHRDGFFRGLKDIAPGDVLELVRPQHSDRYAVSQIRIVTPEDTSVLNPTTVPTLTLVTCFPFYFVGHAPKRYIVTAQLDSEHESYFVAREDSSPTGNENKNKEKKNDRN